MSTAPERYPLLVPPTEAERLTALQHLGSILAKHDNIRRVTHGQRLYIPDMTWYSARNSMDTNGRQVPVMARITNPSYPDETVVFCGAAARKAGEAIFAANPTVLAYDNEEWLAFLAGAHNGEFDVGDDPATPNTSGQATSIPEFTYRTNRLLYVHNGEIIIKTPFQVVGSVALLRDAREAHQQYIDTSIAALLHG